MKPQVVKSLQFSEDLAKALQTANSYAGQLTPRTSLKRRVAIQDGEAGYTPK